MKDKLIKQAIAVAQENGRSVEGLDTTVSEWSNSWKVWFTPRDRRRAGGSGFVVEIYKDGKTPPRILKGQ
jgi:hypothetical protein